MSRMLAADREPDMSWQKGLNDVSKRHHIRIWKQDATWNGEQLWIAAATRDVDFALRSGLSLTHRIATDVDEERDKIAHDLGFSACASLVDWWDRPGAPMNARNATGDLMETDGRLAVIQLNQCAAPRVVDITDSEPLRERPNFAKRLVRREILSVRSDFYRRNTYWRSYEAARWMITALQRRYRPVETQVPAEKPASIMNTFLMNARNSSWLR